MSTLSSSLPSRNIARNRRKYLLWTVMVLAALSVLFYSEIPLLNKPEERSQLYAFRWLLIPHAIAGTVAFLIGPFQFSDRLRRHYTRLHRIIGRFYAGSVFLAAPLAMVSTFVTHYPQAIYFEAAIGVQGGAWLITTAFAITHAMQRRFAEHRQWAIRSYAVTFTFVGTRVLQPIPAWNNLGRFGFAVAIIVITCLATLTPQIARTFGRLNTRFA